MKTQIIEWLRKKPQFIEKITLVGGFITKILPDDLTFVEEIKLTKNNGSCDKVIFAMPAIKKEQIEQVYSGKQGCACGCRGTYHDKGNAITLALNKLIKNAKYGIEVIDDYIFSLEVITNEFGQETDRANRIYLKRAK